MRTEKTIGDESFGYVWQDGRLIAESYEYDPQFTQYYIYDKEGSPIAWSYLDEYYYYIKNQQGDITGFTDEDGNVVVTYEYDAWGNLLSYTGVWYLAEYNSLRYRGYVYDNETGLYYLQARYYDPKVGRFINADNEHYIGSSGTVLGCNLYSYCENGVVIKADPNGNDAIVLISKESVGSMGHMGLMFVLAGQWHYWYWGADTSSLSNLNPIKKAFTIATKNIPAKVILEPVCRYNDISNFNTMIEDVNYYLYKSGVEYGDYFESMIYFKGCFVTAFDYFIRLKRNKEYNLLNKNCMQTSLTALLNGNFDSNNSYFKSVIRAAIKCKSPTLAFDYIVGRLFLGV